jgi:hypothetical protein
LGVRRSVGLLLLGLLLPACGSGYSLGQVFVWSGNLSFSAAEGGAAPPEQTVEIAYYGTFRRTWTWTASSDRPWLVVAPSSGSAPTCEGTSFSVGLDPAWQLEAWEGSPPTAGAPSAREDHDACWTGTHMILWGGETAGGLHDSGGLYSPSLVQWTGATATTGAPSPRTLLTTVWTGSRMLVWGGSTGTQPVSTYYGNGRAYDPQLDQWGADLSTTGAPSPRSLHTAVWTGTEMIVWGGYNGIQLLGTGGRYDPATGQWTGSTSTVGAPSPRLHHHAVWTGTEMIVWGGQDSGGNRNDGALYDPAADTWRPMSSVNAPAARQAGAAAWTGREMVVWGGHTGVSVGDGARYNPVMDAWVAPTTAVGAPTARQSLSAVWTGTRMIVSHGASTSGSWFQNGGVYRPPDPAIGPHTATITIDFDGPNGPSSATLSVDVLITP